MRFLMVAAALGRKLRQYELVSIQSDPALETYNDATYLTGHYKGEGTSSDLGYPVDYKVPSFGEDEGQQSLAQSLKWAETSLNHELEIPDPKKWESESPAKVDYPVPNFGPDQDVIDTTKSLINAQLVHQTQL